MTVPAQIAASSAAQGPERNIWQTIWQCMIHTIIINIHNIHIPSKIHIEYVTCAHTQTYLIAHGTSRNPTEPYRFA